MSKERKDDPDFAYDSNLFKAETSKSLRTFLRDHIVTDLKNTNTKQGCQVEQSHAEFYV